MTDGATGHAAPVDGPAQDERPPLSHRPGDGSVSRAALQRDTAVRKWGPVSPSATRIGRADSPGADVSDGVRRLHEERHPAMEGHSSRMHRLEKIRITHALCNELSLTPWQRDRAIGVMADLDLTVFGSQRAVPRVALVVIRHVVDTEREHYLGLHDDEWVASLDPDRMGDLYGQFHSITDEDRFEELLDTHGLDRTSLNRLRRVLRDELDGSPLEHAVFGRNPYRDPNLPSIDLGVDGADADAGADRRPRN